MLGASVWHIFTVLETTSFNPTYAREPLRGVVPLCTVRPREKPLLLEL